MTGNLNSPPPFPANWKPSVDQVTGQPLKAEQVQMPSSFGKPEPDKPVKETPEQRASRMKIEKDARKLERLQDEQDRTFAIVTRKIEALDPELPGDKLARVFCRLMLPDMLTVVAEVALNRMEPGAARVNAANTMISRAAGGPREYVTKLEKSIAAMSHAETAAYLLEQEQNGLLSMEETKHLLELSQARQEDRVSALEKQVKALMAHIQSPVTISPDSA